MNRQHMVKRCPHCNRDVGAFIDLNDPETYDAPCANCKKILTFYEPEPESEPEPEPAPEPGTATPEMGTSESESEPRRRVERQPDATDAAVELAEENGIDLRDVVGTGSGGRIIKSDVQEVL